MISGRVHGGRAVAVLIILHGVAMTYVLVRSMRISGRIVHLVVGVLLTVPVGWLDSWIADTVMEWDLPLLSIVVGPGLAYNLARFAWRSRRPPCSNVRPSLGPQAPAESGS